MRTFHWKIFTLIFLNMQKPKYECKIQRSNYYLRLGKFAIVLGINSHVHQSDLRRELYSDFFG